MTSAQATTMPPVTATTSGPQMGDRRPARPRRSRSDYLDAAVALAHRRPGAGGGLHAYAVAHVDIAQVAEAAGVSRTALYRLWDTQDCFRADLAAFLAERDDAPWMEHHARGLAPPLPYPGGFHEVTRQVLDLTQDDLASDPRPLVRAGIAGYPDTGPASGALAERERWRLARHATAVGRALRGAKRRGAGGVVPPDISAATAGMADGMALAARLAPSGLLEPVRDRKGRPCSLLTLATNALVDGLTEPAPTGPPAPSGPPAPAGRTTVPTSPVTWREPQVVPPSPPVEHSGRRRHYLDLAAGLATRERTGPDLPVCCGLGFVSLEDLARTEGVTRAAFRKLWPTQAAFGLDLSAHVLVGQRQAVADQLVGAGDSAGPGVVVDVLAEVGEELYRMMARDRTRISHLSVAGQLVLPAFRHHLRRQVEPELDRAAGGLARLLEASGRRLRPDLSPRQLAVLVVALVDGTTRLVRSLPEAVRDEVPFRGTVRSLPAIAFTQLVMGLTQPTHPHDRSAP